MKKASNRGFTTKPSQKKPVPKKLAAKPARPKKSRGGAVLAEAVARLAVSAEKLAQAADRLADAATHLSVAAEARQESAHTPSHPAADSITPQPQSEATIAVEDEQPSNEQEHAAGQGGLAHD
jgi:hypothetical protein